MAGSARTGNIIIIETDGVRDGYDLMEFNSKISAFLNAGEKIISMNVIEYGHTGIEYRIAVGYQAIRFMLLVGPKD